MRVIRQSPKRNAALLLALVLTVGLAACGGSSSKDTSGGGGTSTDVQQGGAITVAADQELTSFNTNTSADNSLWSAMIVRLIWPQTYFQTPDLRLEPSWILDGKAEVVKENPFTVRWKVKQEAVWSDGKPVGADDLEYYWQSCNGAVDPGEPTTKDDAGKTVTGVDCVATDGYDKVTKFTKVDPKTVDLQFSQVISEYESLFSNPMPPAHIAKQKGKDAWATAFVSSPVVSAGPYMLKEYKKGDSLTLERNPKYPGPPPHLDTITFRFIEQSKDEPPALANGEVDLIYPKAQLDLTAQVEQIAGVHATTTFGVQWEHLTFNFKNAILADANVRKAIALGIDRAAVVDTLLKPFDEKAAVLNNRLYLPSQPEYKDQAGEFANRNLDQAKQLLDTAGWKVGSDGIREKDGKKLTLKIATTGGDALREKVEELLNAQFKEFGVDLKIDNRPGTDVFDVIFGGPDTESQWDIALFAWVDTVTPAISTAPSYGTDQGNNPGAYTNPQVDALFDKAIGELDATKKADELNEIDRLLWTDLPDIPLYQSPTYLAYYDKYVNIVDNTTSEGFTWNAQDWGIKS